MQYKHHITADPKGMQGLGYMRYYAIENYNMYLNINNLSCKKHIALIHH